MIVWAVMFFVVAVGLFWFFGPREPVVTDIVFDSSQLQAGVDPYLARREARFEEIVPGVEKRVKWAGAPETRTDWAVVYIHGFSATSEEVRPLPDTVARALRANLVFTRLTGHGRGGPAMAEATVESWMRDVAEALAVARAAGTRVLVISTSTGGTLTALSLHEDMSEGVAGAVFISPNFKVKSGLAGILCWPGARAILPLLAGKHRAWTPLNADHARYWTARYPIESVLPMGAAVKAMNARPHEQITVPALFVFDENDQTVDHAGTRAVAARWGGPAQLHVVDTPPGNDPGRHVIAGDILSPGLTQPLSDVIINWAKAL